MAVQFFLVLVFVKDSMLVHFSCAGYFIQKQEKKRKEKENLLNSAEIGDKSIFRTQIFHSC